MRRPVVEEHRRASRRWKGLLSELAALGRFKQRLGAYYKFSRLIHFVPRAQAREEAARQLLARADARLAEIAARAAHDLETNQLVVPQHLAAEYADWLAERDRAQQEILRVNKSLQGVAERVRGRLSKAKLPGCAEVPALRILAPVSESLRAPGAVMTGAALDVQVARLEELLGVKLRATPDRSMEHPAAQSDRI